MFRLQQAEESTSDCKMFLGGEIVIYERSKPKPKDSLLIRSDVNMCRDKRVEKHVRFEVRMQVLLCSIWMFSINVVLYYKILYFEFSIIIFVFLCYVADATLNIVF